MSKLSLRGLVAGQPSAFRNRLNYVRQHTFPLLFRAMPRAALRLIPGSSESFGPPRRSARWREFRQRPGVAWRMIYPERTERLPSPFFSNDSSNALSHGREIVWPEAGVAEIPGGRILDDDAWIVGPGDTFLGEFCYYGLTRFSRANQILMLHPRRQLRGRTLNLCSANSSTNFFHFVIDSISRAHLVNLAGYKWDDFDQIIFPRFSSPMTEAIVSRSGIPRDKLIFLNRRQHFECELLIQPSFPGPMACTPGWVTDYFRQLFPPAPAPRGRRLYFPRRGNRHPANEADLDARLVAHGFETVDPMKTQNLREQLGQASHVVGVHGAGLANLVFCAPGTRVLELMPSEISAHYNRWFYYTLCASGGMPYGVVYGQSRAHRLTSFSPQAKTPFDVNLADFDRAMHQLLESP